MRDMLKLVMKIAAAVVAVAAVVCLVITQWDKIVAAVNKVSAKLCPQKAEDEFAYYDEDRDGVYFKAE